MNLLFSRTPFFTRHVKNHYLLQSIRSALVHALILAVFLTSLGSTVAAQTSAPITAEIENDHFVVYLNNDGDLECREATPLESEKLDQIRSPKDLRQINHTEAPNLLAATGQLTIILLATANLDANPAAKAAFTRAAAAWESRITSSVTLYMEADVGPNFFGGSPWETGVLGQTTTPSSGFSYSTVRSSLLAGANTPAKQAVYNALPTTSLPTDVNNATQIAVPRPVARAIGLLDPIAQPTDNPPRIGFNSAVNFDYDRSNGITGFDFEAIATHEIGHALGFVSRSGATQNTIPAIWDLYRFRSGTTSGTFTNAQRIMTVGGPTSNSQYYFVPGQSELGLSDGGPEGVTTNNADGNQSSHWRQQSRNPGQVLIGIMDPRIPTGTQRNISDNDTAALSIFGFNSDTASPANDNFSAAQVLSGCAGSVTGTNIGATQEGGEPNHSPDGNGGTHSVWYRWQAPVTGSVTVDTIGSGFDTVLAVYTGSSVNALTVVDKKDDIDPGVITSSRITFTATAGVIYRIAVDGYKNSGFINGEVGPITLNFTQNGCGNGWVPTTLNSNQVELKSWTIDSRTSIYVKLTFSDAGFRVSNWGVPSRTGNDFSADALVERFTGGSAQVITTTAQIYDLGVIAPGSYTFAFKNSGTTVKTLSFTVTGTAPPANPIDGAREFVRWQYKDFLRREPDGPGWDHWTGEITMCTDPSKRFPGETEPQCVERKRANTSAAFFLSPEFQNTGYFVLRVYRGSLGRMPRFGGSNTAQDEFTRDAATVGAGIVVNNSLAPNVINANKQAFVNEFVTRAEFRAIYDGLSNTQYVDRLFQTTGVTPSAPERQALIDGLTNSTETRASVLFKVVDGTQTITDGHLVFQTNYGKAFYDNLFNAAFVQMEYFGYLLRDPDDAGYAFWLGKLNQFGNWVDAQMVLAFIKSPEYRSRFGAP